MDLILGAVYTGSVSQRCDWGQSEPPLRALLRPVWLCCSGEYIVCVTNNEVFILQ